MVHGNHAAATHTFEVKRHSTSGHSNDCLTVAPGDSSAANFTGAAYRVPGCKGYADMHPASVMSFATEAEAQQAGYRKAKNCP